MLAIKNAPKAVRKALANEGWRFTCVSSVQELKQHHHSCRGLALPAASESDNRVRSIREQLLRQIPWEMRGQPTSRWLSYLSKESRRNIQPHLPLAAEFCLTHGFIFLAGDMWAERAFGRWRPHREDGPALSCDDRELYFWRGWQVAKDTVMTSPTTERILAESNQTDREVLLQRLGIETFTREAQLTEIDTFRDSALLKVDTAVTRGTYRNRGWMNVPASLAFLKVICPSTQKTYFLRVNPDVETAKQALESTLPGYSRDWEHDLVAET
jgi:hypothetical protein